MKSRTSHLKIPTMLTLAAGACAAAANPGIVVIDGQGSQLSNGESDAVVLGTANFNRFISDDTIAENLDIFADREAIAQLAVWVGPGPTNIQPILAGDPNDWLENFRAEAAAYYAANAGLPQPGVVIGDAGGNGRKKMVRRNGGSGLRGIKGGAQSFDAGGPTSTGDQPDNTAHAINRLWPTIEIDGAYVAQIPYSFDDDMIAAWTNPDPSEEEQNAIAGIASSLATMLIIEQFAPVQFIGFNPQTDPENGFLLFSNSGDADFDPTTGQGPNTVSRLGRANTADEDAEPTTLTHESWSNFPSIVRSLGFVLGLDWEQRHPDRDSFITVQPQNILPQTFPLPVPPLDGNLGPGVTTLNSPDPDLVNPITAGPLLFADDTVLTLAQDTAGCGFDLDSIMLLRPFDLGGSATYIINDSFRYIDIDEDGNIDTTPFGDDDRMASQPPSIFFSDCDLAAISAMYSVEFRWYYGLNPNCPHDVNNDGIQSASDIQAFVALWEASDPSADLVPPFGVIDILDLQAFSQGDEDNGIGVFTPGFCNDFGLPGPGFRPGGSISPPG